MTPWRAEQLWQLYLTVYNELTRELESERIESRSRRSAGARRFSGRLPHALPAHPFRRRDRSSTWRSTPYGVSAAWQWKSASCESAWQLTLVAADRPGLFASAAGTLSSFGMNILNAEAFSNRRGLVLDTFHFADPNRTLDLNPSEIDRLRITAERVISGRRTVAELLQNRPKPDPPSRKARIPASVAFDADGSATATLIEIVAEDRPGLLYDLASAISSLGGNIEVVLIDTEAHKAIDVFYVTKGGRKLDAAERETLGDALRTAIGEVRG